MAAPALTCPHCDGEVARVNHTLCEQPVALPCGHPVHYRFERDGTVTLRAANGPQQAAVVNPIPRSA